MDDEKKVRRLLAEKISKDMPDYTEEYRAHQEKIYIHLMANGEELLLGEGRALVDMGSQLHLPALLQSTWRAYIKTMAEEPDEEHFRKFRLMFLDGVLFDDGHSPTVILMLSFMEIGTKQHVKLIIPRETFQLYKVN